MIDIRSIDQLRRYLRPVRPEPASRVFAKLCFVAGEQAQCDWASCGKLQIGKGQRPLSLFVMVLSYSRYMNARFTIDQTFEAFARDYVRAFTTFSGVPRTVLCDNLKDELTDFDIALDACDTSKLAQHQAALDENHLTLLAFDIVDLATLDPEFRNRILSEAKDITNF